MTADTDGALAAYRDTGAAVIGATGFIGRAVVQALGQAEARVDLIVRDGAAAETLRKELRTKGQVWVCDVRDPDELADAIATLRPTITFNLAGYGVAAEERDEAESFRVNAEFVRALCDVLVVTEDGAWVGRTLVHVGSQLEYGRVARPFENVTAAPDTVYGRAKLEGTLAVEEAGRARGLRGVTARLFNVYGPGEPAGRLLPSLVAAATTGSPLDLTAGRQRLDFTYVEDVAEALLRLGALPGDAGEVVNVATGRLTSVRDFTLEAASQLEIPAERLNFGALAARAEESRYENVPIERLRERTSWSPSTGVPEGIRRTLQRSSVVIG